MDSNPALMRRATYASVLVSTVLVIIKLVAWFLTGSVSLLSSLIDSALDMMASILNMFAVRHSLTPADEVHRFGHGKIEPLAGLGQAAFITGSSVFLCIEATHRLINPQTIEKGQLAIYVMLISLMLSIGLILYQRHVISCTDSLAIKADAIHYLNDIGINLGVILALILTVWFDWKYADPVIALIIVGLVMYSVWKIGRQSFDQLMDSELPDEKRNRIYELVQSHSQVIQAHDLRTRKSGQDTIIQLHIVINGDTALKTAHDVAVEVEELIKTEFPNSDIIIHQDPDTLY
ncbi:MAG: cation diffusion facilitator family transporter [Gammaproteobacteria bacterium]|nr:cation diffusion facilitator family transporter [Gammaproteobacteria bacterium]